MTLPSLSPEERDAALKKAAEARRIRADIRRDLKSNQLSLSEILDRSREDEVVGRMKVASVLESLPGVGKIRAARIMERIGISDARRLRGLGANQRRSLLDEFTVR